ncbi:MAG: alpha/beta hydrolase [Sphingomonas bacterium]|nr:alpha/beta hydrolase [Sphingomonas bacterium]MDB5688178.1 alpha/beta hydrolase [Sphingomonas bacterium]
MDTDLPPPDYVTRADGVRLAYRYRPGRGPTILFLPGYMSDMTGGKAAALDAWAAAQGRAMLRLDYSGCGASSGAFEAGTLDVWRDDVLAVIDAVAGDDSVGPVGPIVPIGSSMGGWLMLLVALARPAQVAGLIGIAAAPDFTEWGYSDAEKHRLAEEGRISVPSIYGGAPYVTTAGFWRSGAANLLLEGTVPIRCPVRLLHGRADADVPFDISLRLAAAVESSDVDLLLIKDGDHRLSRPADIAKLIDVTHRLLESLP